MRRLILASLALLVPLLSGPALAQAAHRVADINTAREDFTDPLFTQGFAVLGTTVLFLQDDGVHGVELWKSDGTAAGTVLLKDVCPGVCWSWPRTLTVANGALYFSADDGVHGRELWKTDGTAAGTAMVADLNPGLSDSNPSLLEAGGILYLAADDGVHGRELWRTDGTAAGTQLVADIQPGPVGSDPSLRLDTGSRLLLNADDGAHGREPWLSDGTAAGTTLLLDVQPGAGGSSTPFPVYNTFENDALALGGGAFLFTADDGVHGIEPWVSDGTPGGTALLLDISPGSDPSFPHGFLRLGSRILFGASAPATGSELWSTDGTAAGTALLKDLDPGPGNGNVRALTAVGGQAYFAASDGTRGVDLALWKTDGTTAGTVQVTPGADPGLNPIALPPVIQPFDGGVLFFGDDAAHGVELWKSDGTAAGTALVKDAEPGPGWGIGRGAAGVAVMGGTAFFRGITTAHGSEIWKTDGTAAGTAELRNVQALASSIHVFNSSSAGNFQNLGGELLLGADDGATGIEPWISDGTAAGTTQLADLVPGPDWSDRAFSLPVGGTHVLGFSAGLWTTDGTPAGTSPLLAGGLTSAELPAVAALGKVFFRGNTALWRTDGTTAGTAPVAGYYPSQLTPFGPMLLYVAAENPGDLFAKLWRTDGTSAGSAPLTAANPALDELVALGSVALFTADGPGSGTELWATDGTPGGTGLLKDLLPGAGSSAPRQLVRLGGTALFTAFDPAHGRELWASDGTAAGTGLVLDISPGSASSDPTDLTVAGGRLFFVADDGAHGRELWVSDGTPAGTRLVKDAVPGAGSPVIQGLRAIDHLAVYSADDGVHGRELWRSDGGAVGTFLAQDLAPGAAPSSPLDFTAVGADVFFAANDGVTGFEPWAVSKAFLFTTFQDVPPSSWAWNAVEALAANGLTNGCAPGSYCPDATVTRAEMGVFLGRSLHGVTFAPPPATGTRFDDVPAAFWAADWIEQIAADGVTQGCGASPPLYCPGTQVSRAEMAVFLLRSRHGGGYVPPPATGARFADVPASFWAAPWIEQLAAEGITNGCDVNLYCPGRTVARAEMAVFLARTFHLALP